MTDGAFYGAARARRSLWHFLGGKSLSAVTGVVYLVWVVRLAPPAEYGTFVVLLALLEVFYLVTGLGLSTMAQRYVAEFRQQAPRSQFQSLVVTLLQRRLLSAALGALVVVLAWPGFSAWLRLDIAASAGWWVACWLLVGCGTRYLDEVLPALLMQGASQLLSTLANVLRLAGLAVAAAAGLAVGCLTLLWLELAVATVVLAGGLVVLRQHMRLPVGPEAACAPHHNAQMWQVALRFYLVQVLGQAWSLNTARMLVSRLAGAVQTASFGFSQALVDILRNYLPSYLLATWVRPLMVARYVATRRVEPVVTMAGAVFKLSLITLAPFVGLLALHGDAAAAWISGGRYGAGAGQLMASLVVLLALQSLHLCLGMVCTTLERAAANIWATAACTAALPLAWLLWPWLGLFAVPLALGLAEVVWVVWVAVSLRRAGFDLTLDWLGLGKVLVAAGVGAATMVALPVATGPGLLLTGATAVLVVLFACVVLRPLSPAERDLFAQVVPRRWLLM